MDFEPTEPCQINLWGFVLFWLQHLAWENLVAQLTPFGVIWGSPRTPEPQSCVSQCRETWARAKWSVRLDAREACGCAGGGVPRQERGRLQFWTQSAGEEEGEDLCVSCTEAVLLSPAPPPGWAGTSFLSLHGQARFTYYSCVCMSLGALRPWARWAGCGPRAAIFFFTVLGHILASVAWLCCQAGLLGFVVKWTCFLWVIISLKRSSIFFLLKFPHGISCLMTCFVPIITRDWTHAPCIGSTES